MRGAVVRTATALLASMVLLGLVSPASATPRTPGVAADVSAGVSVDAAARGGRPDIVLVLVDDAPTGMLDAMPTVRRQIVNRGVLFRNGMVPTSLCCPSRASLLTGNYSHTTGVYLNGDRKRTRTIGGWWTFRRSERSTLATRLDAVGYRTALIGKYINEFKPTNPRYVPAGWDRFITFTMPVRRYYDYRLQGSIVKRYGSRAKDYSTDVLTRHAVRFVRSTPARTPMFLLYAPFAPHEPYTPARRHLGTWRNEPLSPAFNEQDVSDKPAFIQRRGKVSAANQIRQQRRQHEMLMAVDDGVRRIVKALGERRRDTLFVYMSDNGYVHGAHRFVGKNVPYRDATDVPLAIRWDGRIAPRTVSNRLTSNIDVTATIAEAAGVSWPMDGRSALTQDREFSLLEQAKQGRRAYCGYRSADFLYVRWSGGREELYDYRTDPHELQSLHADPAARQTLLRLRAATDEACRPRPPGFRWD